MRYFIAVLLSSFLNLSSFAEEAEVLEVGEFTAFEIKLKSDELPAARKAQVGWDVQGIYVKFSEDQVTFLERKSIEKVVEGLKKGRVLLTKSGEVPSGPKLLAEAEFQHHDGLVGARFFAVPSSEGTGGVLAVIQSIDGQESAHAIRTPDIEQLESLLKVAASRKLKRNPYNHTNEDSPFPTADHIRWAKEMNRELDEKNAAQRTEPR